ncbi:putative ABC transporter ATP-binding protein [Nocardiopsis terrae]|uniref:ATP-binding cassette subfamily C protein n=1 Tax=Nocardiopsis terrae TaxID=372655 RepID=A0ABR9HAB4_9ACTN|nr:ABC transporter ATP-binding protein [Nocardiopsis terrae]MBE1455972.1 ATP-binding cassette subfamily C protein [Nocardiopsis terrae]GHC96435.1 putative ABC transporter ATP-binding protein [Nocardiopsis terrae]
MTRQTTGDGQEEQEGRAAVLSATAWRDMFSYLRPQRSLLFFGGFFALLGSLVAVVQPVAAKMVVDGLDAGEAVNRALLFLTLLVVLAAVFNTIGYYVLQRIAESVVLESRRRLLGRLLRLRLSETSKYSPGDLMSRVTTDTTLLRTVVSQALVETVTGGVVVVAILIMMATLDLVLLGATAGVLALAAVVVGMIVPHIQTATGKVQSEVGDLNASLERTLGTFRTVKAAGAEHEEITTSDRAARNAWKHGLRVGLLEAVNGTAVGIAVQLTFLAVLGVGGARVVTGDTDVGTLIAFLLYVFYLVSPMGSLVSAAANFNAGAAALSRIREVLSLDTEPGLARPPEPAGAEDPEPAGVAFEDVVFRYTENGPLVHRGVGFNVPPRGLTAFVGPSGAGKSTVFALLERFYEPESGAVLVDGRDVREWPLAELRSVIGYVEQDAPVLAGTLRENLTLGARGVGDEEIGRVIAKTRLGGLVERLPKGLETQVGHRGSSLSGGERQRVAIARALLRSPRLLLLDEATSQLDANNEMAIREIVEDLREETTVMVVAHRLSTVTVADRIVVMEEGEIRAVGSHDELVAGDGLYRDLASTQFLVAQEVPGLEEDREEAVVGGAVSAPRSHRTVT